MCPFGGLYCLILDGGWTRCTSGLIFHGFPGRTGGGALPDSEHPHPAIKHNTFSQCWHNVGPASQTVGQHYTSISSVCCVCISPLFIHLPWVCADYWRDTFSTHPTQSMAASTSQMPPSTNKRRLTQFNAGPTIFSNITHTLGPNFGFIGVIFNFKLIE